MSEEGREGRERERGGGVGDVESGKKMDKLSNFL